MSPIVRKNITHLYVFRLRNQADLDAWADELSAAYDKKTVLQLYRLATDIPHSFLYISLMSKTKEDMFYIPFKRKLLPR